MTDRHPYKFIYAFDGNIFHYERTEKQCLEKICEIIAFRENELKNSKSFPQFKKAFLDLMEYFDVTYKDGIIQDRWEELQEEFEEEARNEFYEE